MNRTLNDIMNEIMAKLPELTTRQVILIANAIKPMDPTIAAMYEDGWDVEMAERAECIACDGDVLLELGIFE